MSHSWHNIIIIIPIQNTKSARIKRKGNVVLPEKLKNNISKPLFNISRRMSREETREMLLW